MSSVLATVQGTGTYVPPAPFDVDVIVNVGQSLTFGPGLGEPTVTGAIQYWDTDVTPNGSGITSSFWHPLHGVGVHQSHGPDRSIGSAMIAADPAYSGKLAILTVAYGSSFYTYWAPGGPAYAPVKAAIQAAVALLPSAFAAGARFRFRQVRNLGQGDIRVNSLPYQQGWGAAQLTWTTNLETDIVAPAMPAGTIFSWKPQLIIRTQSGIVGAFFENTGVRPSQASIVDANHLLDIDPPIITYQSDGVHPVYYPALDGTVKLGALTGARIALLDSLGQ